MQSTYVPKADEIQRRWWIVDATDLVLGRMCTEIARHLSGKNKPQYTPYLDTGDHVIVVNAERVQFTGAKLETKTYYRHTGYPGGIKATTASALQGKHPDRIIKAGVKGMLPKNKLGRKMLTKLKVYAGPEHPHSAQQPASLEISGAVKERSGS